MTQTPPLLWFALVLEASSSTDEPSAPLADRDTVAAWGSQFTPRVALAEANAVLLEVASSLRLFGGRDSLVRHVEGGARELGIERLGWAPTGLAALAFARCGVATQPDRPLQALLDSLPLQALADVVVHAALLERLGCRTLGHVRALPRGGVARRFGVSLLAALDRAYGLRAEAYAWFAAPETFSARLELPGRVELATALLFAARRLLTAMAGWLAARHAGVCAVTLRWRHDAMRARESGAGGELAVRTAQPTRSVEHLTELLGEHLSRMTLAAPVGEVELEAMDVRPLETTSATLLPAASGAPAGAEPLALVLERLAARLGPQRVLQPNLVDDHRPEWMCRWQPAGGAPLRRWDARAPLSLPQPTFLLAEPLRLATRGPLPVYQGPLQMLAGPHRVEGGWWHRTLDADGCPAMHHVARDYWVAASAHAGLLWVFRTRLDGDETGWFLHGCFA